MYSPAKPAPTTTASKCSTGSAPRLRPFLALVTSVSFARELHDIDDAIYRGTTEHQW
jgi:hypothetical protein